MFIWTNKAGKGLVTALFVDQSGHDAPSQNAIVKEGVIIWHLMLSCDLSTLHGIPTTELSHYLSTIFLLPLIAIVAPYSTIKHSLSYNLTKGDGRMLVRSAPSPFPVTRLPFLQSTSSPEKCRLRERLLKCERICSSL